MKNMTIAVFVGCSISLIACESSSREAEKHLEILKAKVSKVDSLISVETRKLQWIDSALNQEFDRTGKLDSLVTYESKRIDSLVHKAHQKIRKK